jgi:hypothetical protein
MIGPGTGVRVYLACGVTDMRNYALIMIMRSRRGRGTELCPAVPISTPHN